MEESTPCRGANNKMVFIGAKLRGKEKQEPLGMGKHRVVQTEGTPSSKGLSSRQLEGKGNKVGNRKCTGLVGHRKVYGPKPRATGGQLSKGADIIRLAS